MRLIMKIQVKIMIMTGEEVQFVVPAPVASADTTAPAATTVETPSATNAPDEVDKW